jgi:5-methylcytosine-specific restriction endonuclease McrA
MAMRKVVLIEEPVCKICGRKPSEQVDHKVPICKGGTDQRDNLQGICDECHDIKTAKDLGIKGPKDKIGLDGYPIKKERA